MPRINKKENQFNYHMSMKKTVEYTTLDKEEDSLIREKSTVEVRSIPLRESENNTNRTTDPPMFAIFETAEE